MIKKLLTLAVLSTMIFTTLLNPSIANQSNHGQNISNVAKSTEPGPQHGQIVSEAAKTKSNKNYALSFDGLDDYVTIPHKDIHNVRSNFTIEFWLKFPEGYARPRFPGDGEVGNYILTKHVSGWANGYIFAAFTDGHVWAGVSEPGVWQSNFSQTNVYNEQWHHVSLISNGNEIQLFIDGQLESSRFTTGNFLPSLAPLEVGRQLHWSGPTYSKVDVDEVRIWNKTLTREEIQANMFREIEPQDGLVGYWRFDEGTGTVAYDSSGNGNDGTLVNSPTWTTDTPF